jgi:hypothetical protein
LFRSAPRSPRTWGTSAGFGHCPDSLGRVVDGFSGPWHALDVAGAPRESFDCVVVAVRTLSDLRRIVPMHGLLPSTGRVRVVLAEVPPWAARPMPVPGQSDAWQHLADLRVTRTATGWHLDASFTEPVAAGEVVASVARGLLGTGRHASQPVIGLAGDHADEWRPGDANATPADLTLSRERRDAPGCDLLLRLDGDRAEVGAGGAHIAWETDGDHADAGALPPVDEAVVNPIGFRRHPRGPLAALEPGFAVTSGSDVLVRLGPRGELTDAEVACLRDVRGVMIPSFDGEGPAAAGTTGATMGTAAGTAARTVARIVAGLAAAGVPAGSVPATDLPVTVVEAPAGLPFGAVLNRMAAVASGTFLAKVDDDDWYGPDHLADLLLAQLYSGADLVGSAPEFVYLEPLDVTIRRRVGTERFAPFVAGGTS